MLVGENAIAGAVMFRTSNGLGFVLAHREKLATLGAYLLVIEHGTPSVDVHSGSGANDKVTTLKAELDHVGLLAVTDQFEVVRLLGTNGNRQHDNPQIVAWLREVDRAQPLVLLGAGYDFVEGAFRSAIREPRVLAHDIYSFCPDAWDAGPALIEKGPPEPLIAQHLAAENVFYCWWD